MACPTASRGSLSGISPEQLTPRACCAPGNAPRRVRADPGARRARSGSAHGGGHRPGPSTERACARRGAARPRTRSTRSSSRIRRSRLAYRGWVKDSGGVLAADSPKLMFDLIDVLRAGRPSTRSFPSTWGSGPAILDGTSRRSASRSPTAGGAWHQGRRIHGRTSRALNVWLSLHALRGRCARTRPSYLGGSTTSCPTGTDDANLRLVGGARPGEEGGR